MPYGRISSTKVGNTGAAPTNNNLPDFTYSQGNGKEHNYFT
jgi:hypothetical protein